MKKVLVLLLLILLVSPLILAANDTVEDVSDATRDGLSALRGGIDNQTENVLANEVTLPNFLRGPFKVLLGIEEKTTWQKIIIVLGVLIGVFLIMLDIIELMPIFDSGVVKVLASAAMTLLFSVTGALTMAAEFFFNLAGFLDFANSWAPGRIILAIIIAAVGVFVLKGILYKLKDKIKIKTAHMSGQKIHEAVEDAKAKDKSKPKH